MNKKRKFGWIIRLGCLIFGLVAFVWFLLPYVAAHVLNIGNVTGMIVAILFMVYVAFLPAINQQIRKWWQNIWKRCLIGLVGAFIALCMILVVVESGFMIGACMKVPKENATAVVLGCRVYGERASLSLLERINAAYAYLIANPDAKCVVSGGKGNGENISEAECMYRYLIDMGIEAERIYKEDKSTSTEENLKYSLEVIKENGLNENIAIVTSEYHAYRAGLNADACGLSYGTAPGKTAIWLFPTYYVRELYGILEAWVF